MSANPAPPLTLWLPALRHFDAAHPLRRELARADRLQAGAEGYLGGLADYFPGMGSELPAAALMRELIASDAGDALWLCADPAWVQPDMNGVRLLACGRLQLNVEDAHALANAVRPVIHDAGLLLETTTPDRWHLKFPRETALPAFVAPEQGMGEDLSQHLPRGEEGRPWRLLFNEIQVVLHQHPLNAHRRAQGLPPINSLWFWGGGHLPAAWTGAWHGVTSDDLLVRALAHHADIAHQPRTHETLAAAGRGWLVDLQDLPPEEIASTWWITLRSLFDRQPVAVHFTNGERWLRQPWHRWRFWRGDVH
jgi:hypothetical protein